MIFRTKMRILEAGDGRPRRLLLGTTSADGGGYYATTLDEAGRRELECLREEDVRGAQSVDVVIAEVEDPPRAARARSPYEPDPELGG
jgi:hypothetical protein